MTVPVPIALLVAGVLQVFPSPSGETATIRGIAVDEATGRGIPRAAVQITDQRVDSLNGLHPARRNATALADDGGRFEVADLPPGAHYLTISRNGYVRMEFGGAAPGRPGLPLTLRGGETRDLAFALEPAARVAGRVTDEQGRAVVGAEVAAVRTGYDAEGREHVEALARTETNDLGEYRLFWLEPGTYLVAARSGATVSAAANLWSPDGPGRSPNVPPAPGYLTHYYPGTPSRAESTTLDLAAGETLTGIDVRLGPARTWSVRGQVDVRLGTDVRATVDLLAGSLRPVVEVSGGFVIGGQSESPVAYSAVVGPDGRFEISGVVPGSYRLVAQANIPESRGLDRRPYVVRTGTNIEVRNRDVDGIELPLGPSAEVRGRVFVEDALPSVTATPGEPPRIRLRTAGGEVVGPSTGVPASTTGEFVFSHVPRGTYSVELAEPGDRYLERVRIDDTEAEPNAVEINGPAVLDLLVSPNVARIAGTVVRDDGTPVPGASIVLMPASERRTLDRQVMADAAGRFSIGGLAPGEYRIVAGVDFHDFAYFDPGFRTRVGSWTDVVTVVEGEEAELPLRVVPRGTGR